MHAVAFLFRQLVGSVTAVMVLLCSVHCACGSSVHRPCDANDAAPTGTLTPHCHGHHDDEDELHGDAHRSESQPCHHDGHDGSCRNCQPALSAESGNKTLTDLTPHGCLFGALVLIPTVQPLDSLLLIRSAIYGDLPPPTPAPTLLSLHCALTT
jgi:hypothetical protein